MKYIFIFSIFFLISLNISAQYTSKISLQLANRLITSEKSDSIFRVWIYFTDKGENVSKKIQTVETELPENALKRRAKLLKSNQLTDSYDLQVNAGYLAKSLPFLAKTYTVSRWLNAISADVSSGNIEKLGELEFVKNIDIVKTLTAERESESMMLFTENQFLYETKTSYNYGESFNQISMIQVDKLHEQGYSGNGVRICVLDAGFNNLEHEAFAGMDILAQYDFVNSNENVDDEADMGYGGHGTKTLSTIGGFKEGALIGPAFGASYMLAKTENTESETKVEEDNWVAALEWAEYMPGGGPDVTSTSLGYFDFQDGITYSREDLDGNTTVITRASDIAARKGILVVNSAANSGPNPYTIAAPADGDSVLAVGAVDAFGIIKSFSSRGPTADGRIKPDVSAQGGAVFVADVTDNNYTTSNGTSFSCPLVAGAAALLVEAFPTASNMDIFNALKLTATQADAPNNDYGWGIIQTYKAYQYLETIYSETTVNEELICFPNPTKGELILNKVALNKEYTLTNSIGQIVRKGTVSNRFRLDISDEKPGFYVLSILSEETVYQCKIVKL